jgi:RND superfamily putative drug exporter
MVGISLDYDIFLLVRIREYRFLGYSTKDAIVKGLHKTGSIITAAGVSVMEYV